MGRGRAKAKQTKVARELKYSSGPLDIGALTAELAHDRDDGLPEHETPASPDEFDDEYADYSDDDEIEDEHPR